MKGESPSNPTKDKDKYQAQVAKSFMSVENNAQTKRANTRKVEWQDELDPNERRHLNEIRNMIANHSWKSPNSPAKETLQMAWQRQDDEQDKGIT